MQMSFSLIIYIALCPINKNDIHPCNVRTILLFVLGWYSFVVYINVNHLICHASCWLALISWSYSSCFSTDTSLEHDRQRCRPCSPTSSWIGSSRRRICCWAHYNLSTRSFSHSYTRVSESNVWCLPGATRELAVLNVQYSALFTLSKWSYGGALWRNQGSCSVFKL